jgi:hypothetical protein
MVIEIVAEMLTYMNLPSDVWFQIVDNCSEITEYQVKRMEFLKKMRRQMGWGFYRNEYLRKEGVAETRLEEELR